MWPFRRRKQAAVRSAQVEAARAERIQAEHRLKVAQRELTVPFRQLRQENHIGPLLNELIQRKVRQGRENSGPAAN